MFHENICAINMKDGMKDRAVHCLVAREAYAMTYRRNKYGVLGCRVGC
jgi:hypothetical protein